MVKEYLKAWLKRLRIAPSEIECRFGTAEGVEFTTGTIGGHLLLDSEAVAQDLVRFAGLIAPLAQVGELAKLNFQDTEGRSGIFEDGLYLPLTKHPQGPAEK
jgi:hypothetical protein